MTIRAPRLTNQLKGIILEEVILALLEHCGYRTITEIDQSDTTLDSCASGIQVRGRGGEHQIDAIADYVVPRPFSYPQRLLVEAKCYSVKDVDLETVRNALGVFRDVSEFWTSPPGLGAAGRRRYSYQYAIFSAKGFTVPAQRFAFAHDIHLLPLGESLFLKPVVRAVEISAGRFAALSKTDPDLRPFFVRQLVRNSLRNPEFSPERRSPLSSAIAPLIQALERVRGGYLAMAAGVFPLFLVPEPNLEVGALPSQQWIRISFDEAGWYIRSASGNRRLFSFDLPDQLFGLYADSGTLSRAAAVNLKQDFLSELQFTVMSEGVPRLVTLQLEPGWVETLRRRDRR